MCELGKRLRESREAKGLELAQAAELLRVRRNILEALEDCRFDQLPEPALARGYLKRYAQLLGLDPAPLLALYPVGIPQFSGPAGSAQTSSTSPTPRWLWLIPLVLLLMLLGWLGLRLLGPQVAPAPVQNLPAPVTPPPVPQINLRVATQPTGARVYLDGFLLGQAPLEARVEAGQRTLRIEAPGYHKYEQVLTLQSDRNLSFALTPIPPAPMAPQPPAPATPIPTTGLVLRLEGTSWIRVTDPRTGRLLYEGTVLGGTDLSYPLPVAVRVGNAGAVRVILDGQDRGLMGRTGQVVVQTFGQ
jgi:cytoskeleton protein RodZ